MERGRQEVGRKGARILEEGKTKARGKAVTEKRAAGEGKETVYRSKTEAETERERRRETREPERGLSS